MSTKRSIKFKFRLYVADNTENSEKARANLADLCARYLPGRCEVEVVDVLRYPERALEDAVFMTPTLIKLWPLPVQRIVGTLNHAGPVLEVLGIKGEAA